MIHDDVVMVLYDDIYIYIYVCVNGIQYAYIFIYSSWNRIWELQLGAHFCLPVLFKNRHPPQTVETLRFSTGFWWSTRTIRFTRIATWKMAD